MKKKLITYLIATAILLGTVGCSNEINIPPATGEVSITAEETGTTEIQIECSSVPAEELPTEESISIQEQFENFYTEIKGGLLERIYATEDYFPEDIAERYTILDVTFVRNTEDGYTTCSQTQYKGKFGINLGLRETCENPEYKVLTSVASCAGYRTDFVPYETEEFLYAWEQEHESDFFTDSWQETPSQTYANFFASYCMQDPAYTYNKENAPLLTEYVADYIKNYDLYCNMDAKQHTCKHEDRKYCSLEMRLNWVKAALPEEVRNAMERERLEFQIIDRSQELVDAAGCEFMGLYCPVGSLVGTSYEGMDHPIIFLVKGYESCFEDTIRHEIGHFVCDYSEYNSRNMLNGYLSENDEKVSYFASDKECVEENVGEYFANAFAYYYCDMCDISAYWNSFCPEINDVIENSVEGLESNTASDQVPAEVTVSEGDANEE